MILESNVWWPVTSIIWELVELKLTEFLWANDVDQAKDRQKPSSKQTIYRLDIRLVNIFFSVTIAVFGQSHRFYRLDTGFPIQGENWAINQHGTKTTTEMQSSTCHKLMQKDWVKLSSYCLVLLLLSRWPEYGTWYSRTSYSAWNKSNKRGSDER